MRFFPHSRRSRGSSFRQLYDNELACFVRRCPSLDLAAALGRKFRRSFSLCVLLVSFLTIHHVAMAQTAFRLEAGDVVLASASRSTLKPELQASASSRLDLHATFAFHQPQLSYVGEVRSLFTLEPEFPDPNTAQVGVSWGSRVLPSLGLLVLAQPKDGAYFGLTEKFTAFATLLDGSSSFGNSPTLEPLVPQEADSNLPDMVPVGVGAAALQGLPRGSFAQEVGAFAALDATPRVRPLLISQFRIFRQNRCTDAASLEASLGSDNYRNDAFSFFGRTIVDVAPLRTLSFDLQARLEANHPMSQCFDPVELPPSGRYVLLEPVAALSLGTLERKLTVRAGVSHASGVLRTASEAVETKARWLPTVGVDGNLEQERIQLQFRLGSEVTTLYGQAGPTYNLSAAFAGGYRFRSELGSSLGFAILRAVSSPLETSGSLSETHVRSLEWSWVGLEWAPRVWFKGGLNAAIAHQLAPLGPESGVSTDLETSLAQEQVSAMILLSATVGSGGGFVGGLHPRFTNW